jgi:hypothetical protein
LSIWRRSIIEIHTFRSVEVKEANGSRGEGGEDGIPTPSLYLHLVLNLYDEMNKLFKGSWR